MFINFLQNISFSLEGGDFQRNFLKSFTMNQVSYNPMARSFHPITVRSWWYTTLIMIEFNSQYIQIIISLN